jgi:hypothetical protein
MERVSSGAPGGRQVQSLFSEQRGAELETLDIELT